MDALPLRSTFRLPPLVWLLILSCCTPLNAMAATDLVEGNRLLISGENEQAYDRLWQVVMSEPDNMTANYLLGRAAMALKLYENAVAAYERILVVDPDQARARLNLGIANYALGAFTAARQELELLLSVNPPPDIRQKAQRYLERIEGRQGVSRLRGLLSIGLVYDSNVDSTSTAQDDWGATVGLGLTHDWDPGAHGGYQWGTRALIHGTFFRQVTDYDLNYLSLESGPGYLRPRQYQLQFPFSYETTRYGGDEYSSHYGIKPRITFFHSPNLSTRLSAAWEYQDFADQNARDGSASRIDLMPRIFWDNEHYMLQWQLGYEWKHARDNINAFRSPDTELLLRVGADRSMQGRFSLQYRNPRYDELNPTDSEMREDEYYKAAATFYLPTPWRDTRTVLAFDYRRNQSNIAAFDYTRKRVMLNLEKEF